MRSAFSALGPRRNNSRKMNRDSGPQYSSCQHNAMGILQPQVWTHALKKKCQCSQFYKLIWKKTV